MLLGGLIVLLLYLVPVVGFLVYKVLGILGLGAVVYTLILAARARIRPQSTIGPEVDSATRPSDACRAAHRCCAAHRRRAAHGCRRRSPVLRR